MTGLTHWFIWLVGMSNQNSGPYLFWSGIGSSLRDVVFLWLLFEARLLRLDVRRLQMAHDPIWTL